MDYEPQLNLFRLPSNAPSIRYRRRAIRMRMYSAQKAEAQKQLEDPNCEMVRLNLDIECRLVSKDTIAK
jgi:hypothetical protein